MMLDFQPKTAAEHKERWAKAVERVWDFTHLQGEVPFWQDRPGTNPDHVFDHFDGLRLIVSTDRYGDGKTYLHVSASANEGSTLYQKLKKGLSKERFFQIVRERVKYISGRDVTFCFLSLGKVVPHFFDPPRAPPSSDDIPHSDAGAVNWRDLVGSGWTGRCIVCDGEMSTDDFRLQQAVASVSERGVVAAHASHFTEDGPGGPVYGKSMLKFAAAVAELEKGKYRESL
jgi:hypothetical protein